MTPRVPAVVTASRTWPADEVHAQAARWRDEAVVFGALTRPLAVVVPRTPDVVALLAACTSMPSWLVLLPPDPSQWPARHTMPDALLVLVPAAFTRITAVAESLGFTVRTLSAPSDHVGNERSTPLHPLTGEGMVLFTSGSTGAPRPVFRRTRALTSGTMARMHALGLGDGAGSIVATSLAHGGGLTRLVATMHTGGAFGMLDPLDHRAALSMLRRPEFGVWAATPHFVDVLSRCSLTGPAVVPQMCLIGSPVPRETYDRFLNRFGVPVRQNYSSSETGLVALDTAPPGDVDPDAVGWPMPGVEVRIGDDVRAPLPTGEIGRIWVRSSWQMDGYGYPPALERPGDVDGWWPTRDLGRIRDDGRLVLAGRMDDCIRTREGRLVNLAAVATALTALTGVRHAAVVPLDGSAGASFGAVVECDADTMLADIRERMTAALPKWMWPRAITQVAEMPRLTSGKVDRRGCLALLQKDAR